MRVDRVEVRNYRSLRDVQLELDGVTYLVGRNGAGKSTLLRAAAVFFQQAAVTSSADFSLGDQSAPIEISVTFSDLGPIATDEFARYLRGDRLRVTKRIAFEGGRLVESYHGSSLQFAGFKVVRAASCSPHIRC
jgi:putative ATP-dependent endonuclease of OLD family